MPANTTGSQDRIYNNADDATQTIVDTVSALKEMIDELDTKLDTANERIKELEDELATAQQSIASQGE